MPDQRGATDRLSGVLAQLDNVLFGEQTAEGLRQVIVDLAHGLVVDLVGASITVRSADRYSTSHFSDASVLPLDQAQYDLGTGPCIEAIRTHEVRRVRFDDGGQAPAFMAEAAQRGVHSVLSLPLYGENATGAGLNLYSRSPAFDADSEQAAATFARRAVVALTNAMAFDQREHLVNNLREAITTREVIGEAKGILMERESCTSEQAFDILRRASQRTNRKLRDIAQDLVQSVEERSTRS